MVEGCSRRRERRAEGYTLVALLVAVTVLNIAIAAALPVWNQVIKRDKEAELVFRGMQYAEAIRVFQLRHGRYPTSLRELREVEPRSIRQLWTDPFNDDGEWGLILAQTPRRAAGVGGEDEQDAEDEEEEPEERRRRQPRRGAGSVEETTPRERVTDDGLNVPRARQVVTRGPITGVRSLSGEEGVRSFMGSTTYSDWLFTADLVPTLAQPNLGENVPRLHSEWVGKALPSGLEALAGGMPSDPFEGLERDDDERRERGDQRRRERRERRSRRRD